MEQHIGAKPLSSDIITDKIALEEKLAPLLDQLGDRLTYILEQTHRMRKETFGSWFVEGAAEGEVGDLDKVIDIGAIDMNYLLFDGGSCHCCSNCDDCAIVLNDVIWHLHNSIPKQWLFQEFETDLTEGRKLFLEQKEELKRKAKEKKKQKEANKIINQQKKQELIASAKNKLSDEEKRALGL